MARDQSDSERLWAAERKIAQHPGYREHLELEALHRSIAAVFVPNRDEVLSLLEAASNDWRLAFELIQNVREPTVRDRFHAQLTQRLHNYLASAASLVDHVRRLMRGRTGPVADKFLHWKEAALQNPEVPFVIDLRNFMLHRTLPLFGHTLSMTNVNKPDQRMESEVQLTVPELLEWDRWSRVSRTYLEGSGDAVAIRPVVKKHAELVLDLNEWLLKELSNANASAMDEVNELIVARNAILTGGDLQEARRISRNVDA
jgi:hypothetical protein